VSIRVGVVGPFSGERSAWGDALRGAASIAKRERPDVDWLIRDDAGEESRADEIARDLVEDGACVVVGHYASSGALHAARHYGEAGVILIAPASSHPELTRGKATVLRLCADDDAQVELIATATRSAAPDVVRVLHDTTRYGTELARRLELLLGQSATVRVERSAAVDRSAHDAGCVVYAGAHHEGARVVRQLRDAGFRGVFLASDDSHIDDFCARAGDSADGAVVVRSVPSFAETTEFAFSMLRSALGRWRGAQREDLHSLLRKGHPAVELDEHGNNVRACWRLSCVVDGRFRPYPAG
jgi:branched-chain amino acid transport system substrate-binding protein